VVTIGDPRAETRQTGSWWRSLSAEDRMYLIKGRLMDANVSVLSASKNGRVVVEIDDREAKQLGTDVREYERTIRRLDDGIRLYLKQAPDMNALRRLRGVVVNEE
jgi:hypothetical protein